MTNKQLARRLVNAADDSGTIQADRMVRLTSDPTLHTTSSLSGAAERLGVLDEVAALMHWTDEDLADMGVGPNPVRHESYYP